jgi:tetratricopeptide (TPR) repeat protein
MFLRNLKFLTSALLLFSCLIGLHDSGYAQEPLNPQQRRQLELQINQLKHRIIQVEQLIRAFNHDLANSFIEEAKKLAQQIEADFRQRNYAAVVMKIRAANATLDKVFAIATDNTLKRLINELQRVMRQAEHEVIGSGNKEAERLLQSAKRHQGKAENALQRGNIRRAYEQFTIAITFAKKSLDLVRNKCESEHTQIRILVVRANQAIEHSNNAQAKRTFEQALKIVALAERACREGRIEAAEQFFNKAVRLLLRVLDMVSTSDPVTGDKLKQELETIKELLGSVKKRLREDDEVRTGFLLRRIEEIIANAENAIVLGRFELAKVHLIRVRRLLESVFRAGSASQDNIREKAASELALLQKDIARMEAEISPENESVREFLQFSRQAANQANRDVASGKYNSALQRILVGQKFIAKADNLQRGGRSSATAALVEISINRLKQRLQEAETALGGDPSTYIAGLLADARTMLRKAENKRAEKKYILALELSEIGKELIATALRFSQSQK